MTTDIPDRGYAHPERLVSTEWVAGHLNDPHVKILESDEDVLLYETGHIPGAIKLDWVADLNDPIRRDYLDRAAFELKMRELGIGRDDTLVFYGDKNNWWACYALWVFELFGHADLRIMDGGRVKWASEGRATTTERPNYPRTDYVAPERDDGVFRAFRERVLDHVSQGGRLVDVRSPDEYSGKKLHMPEYPQEGAMRGGHIPGAASVPWARAVNPDATFKTADELNAIYGGEAGLNPSDRVIAYCRIGERSSHTWFVLRYLLGYPDVRNYDGSWTEWGNLVGVPIER